MSSHISDLFVEMRGRLALLVVLALMLGNAPAAWPQPAQQQLQVAPPQQAAPPAAASPPAPERSNPGLVEELGKLLKDSASGIGSSIPALPSPSETLDGLNSSAKGAADSLKRIAPLSGQTTVAAGRTLCPAAANGAPDCKLAADQLCKANGFAEGRSVDIESAQKCSAKSYFSGNGACRTENFVTRAVCQ